jgi:hypothetical protein
MSYPNPAAHEVAELQMMASYYRARAKDRTRSRAAARRLKSARQFLAIAFPASLDAFAPR